MTDAGAGTVPLAQAIEEYLDWMALDKGRSPNTVRAYRADLERFRGWCAETEVTRLNQVDRELLRAYQRDLAHGPGRRQPLGPATRHRRLVALRSLLRFCAREEWTPGDLGVTIDLPKLPQRLPKPLEDDELAKVTADAGVRLDSAGLRDRALVALLVSTGCRISEALALDRADWRRTRVSVIGKGDTERSVVITDRARGEVDTYLASRTDSEPALFVSYSPGRVGRRLSVRAAEAICTRLGANISTKEHTVHLHPHRLRHTAGTIVQEALGDPRVTAEFLGHRGLGSVAGYTEVSQQRHADAAAALRDKGV